MVTDLSTSDAGCGLIRVVFDATDMLLEYEGHDRERKPIVGRLRFCGVIAFRFRNELHSLGFLKGSYDSVMEQGTSEWLDELIRMEPPGYQDATGKRHFSVLLSSNGYLEVVADGLKTEPALEGNLSQEQPQLFGRTSP